jgi:hypothetical protein
MKGRQRSLRLIPIGVALVTHGRYTTGMGMWGALAGLGDRLSTTEVG